MPKDPICEMTVEESAPLRTERNGETFYFCSEHCRTKFLSQNAHNDHPHHSHTSHHSHPSHTLHAPDAPRSTAAKYFCPMCPGVESDKPGDCPRCGMALERNPSTLNPQPLVAPKPGEGGSTTVHGMGTVGIHFDARNHSRNGLAARFPIAAQLRLKLGVDRVA